MWKVISSLVKIIIALTSSENTFTHINVNRKETTTNPLIHLRSPLQPNVCEHFAVGSTMNFYSAEFSIYDYFVRFCFTMLSGTGSWEEYKNAVF